MADSDPVAPFVKSRVDALNGGTVPSAPPGPGPITAMTWTCLVFSGVLGIAGAAASTGTKDNGCLTVGLIFGGIFLVAFIVGLLVDLSTPSPRSRTTPERGAKAYYAALRRKSYGRAYACLSPLDRTDDMRPTLAIGRLDVPELHFSFDTKNGFAKYWRAQSGVSTGFFGGYHKSMKMQILRAHQINADVAAADIQIQMSGYPALATLGILCGLLPALVLIVLMTRNETFEVRKLLVRRDGLWWIVNGEFSGDGDEAIERLLRQSGKA